MTAATADASRIRWLLFDEYDDPRLSTMFGSAILGVIVLLASLGLVIRTIDHHISKSNCASFGVRSGYDVEFIDIGFWDYDCYVHTPKGLVPRDSIIYVKDDAA